MKRTTRSRLTRFIAFVVAASAASLGAPASHAGGPTSGAPFASFEPSLARMSSGRMIMVYDDEAGAYALDPGGKRTALPNPSWAGSATSDDGGATWTRRSFVSPSPACSDPTCVRAVVGDPHVVGDGLGRPYATFVGLASTTSASPDPPLADALGFSTSRDGVVWSPTRVLVAPPGGMLDKVSVSSAFQTIAASYVSASSDKAHVVSFDGMGVRGDPFGVDDEELAIAAPVRAPILRLRSQLYGYMAYLVPRDAMGGLADVVVVRIDRVKYITLPDVAGPVASLDTWHSRDVVFHRDSVAIDPLVPGALGRKWRDAYPLSFELGHFGNHLYVAYREIAPDYGRSIVVLYECEDYPVGSCQTLEDAHGTFDGWTRHEFDDCTKHGGQYQPTIATSDWSDATFAWYERVSADPNDPRIALKGARSKNGGRDWTDPVDLRGGTRWIPCPSAIGPLYAPHDYGDRFVSFISEKETIRPVTAFVDSTRCDERGEATFDQHVETVQW